MAAYIRRSSAGRRDSVPLLLPRLGELFREGERGIGGMRHLQEAAEVYLLKFAKDAKYGEGSHNLPVISRTLVVNFLSSLTPLKKLTG